MKNGVVKAKHSQGRVRRTGCYAINGSYGIGRTSAQVISQDLIPEEGRKLIYLDADANTYPIVRGADNTGYLTY